METSPKVLLINAPEWLAQATSSLFGDHEIEVESLDLEGLFSKEEILTDQENLYKVIWWVDFSELAGQAQLVELLKQHEIDSLVILGSLPEGFVFDKEQDQVLAEQQDFFSLLTGYFPEAQLLFIRDLLDSETLGQPLAFAFRGHEKQVLLDPQDKWFLTDSQAFFQVSAPYLVRPHSKKRAIVAGKPVMSGELLEDLANFLARYYQDFHQVTPAIAHRSSPQIDEFAQVRAEIDLEHRLDQFARHKDTWQQQLKTLPSPSQTDWRQLEKPEQKIEQQDQDKDRTARDLEQDSFLPPAQQRQQINSGKRLVNQYKNQELPEENEEQLEGKLAKIFGEKREKKTEKRIDEKVKIVKKIAKKSQKNKTLFSAGMVTMVLGGIVLFLWATLFVSTALARGEVVKFFSQTSTDNIGDYQPGFWTKFLVTQTNAYQAILGENWLGESGEFARFQQSFQEFQRLHQQLEGMAGQYFLNVMAASDAAPISQEELDSQLSLTREAAGETISAAEVVFQGSEVVEGEWLTKLQDQQQQLALSTQLPATLPRIFGAEGKRTYAVLLQNNLELRPTGGFIQAIGLFTFDQGILVDTQLVNTYQLDQRVLGSVAAPTEIRRYLGEETWFLRDSNWNPDFPQTAQRVAWFIRQAVGVQVDGVWAVNYYAFQDLIEAAGSLPLVGYEETLTASNLLERVEFHSDDELNSLGENAEEYSLTVFSQLLQKLSTIGADQATAVVSALEDNLDNKQILMSFFDEELESVAQVMGWNGEVINPICPQRFSQGSCLVDQLFQVEANTSLNRVGDYIRRQVKHQIDLSGSRVSHTRTVTLENTARSEGWPLGTYRTYLRFVIDGDAQPQSLTVNGQRVTGDNIMVYGEGGRRVVGVLVEVPIETTTTIELNYLTDEIPQEQFSIMFFDQQQSGTEDTPTIITVYNPNQQPTLIAPTAEVFGNTVEFNLVKNDHLFTGVSFQ